MPRKAVRYDTLGALKAAVRAAALTEFQDVTGKSWIKSHRVLFEHPGPLPAEVEARKLAGDLLDVLEAYFRFYESQLKSRRSRKTRGRKRPKQRRTKKYLRELTAVHTEPIKIVMNVFTKYLRPLLMAKEEREEGPQTSLLTILRQERRSPDPAKWSLRRGVVKELLHGAAWRVVGLDGPPSTRLIAIVSLLIGNFPGMQPKLVKQGVSVADVIRLETAAIRATVANSASTTKDELIVLDAVPDIFDELVSVETPKRYNVL